MSDMGKQRRNNPCITIWNPIKPVSSTPEQRGRNQSVGGYAIPGGAHGGNWENTTFKHFHSLLREQSGRSAECKNLGLNPRLKEDG